LENFSRDGLLWVYDREKGEYRRQTPKNTTLQNHYYTLEDAEGNKDTTVETTLAKIENRAWPVIAKAAERRELSLTDKQDLALFSAFLKVRVPDYEKSLGELFDKLFKATNKMIFHSEEATKAAMESMTDEGEEFPLTAQELMEVVDKEEYELGTPRAESIKLKIDSGLEIARYLGQMNWIFACAPASTSFITSDNPFVFIRPKNHDPHRGVGVITPGAKKVVPLTHDTCLFALDRGSYTGYMDISREAVRGINLTVSANCDRFLIGRDEALVKRLVKTAGIHGKREEGRIILNGGR